MFRIKTKNETVELSKEQLLQSLIQKVTDNRKPDHELLAKTIADYLEVNGVLKNTTAIQLLTLAFSTGYYYKVFLSRNDVTVEIENATTDEHKSTD